MKILDNNSSDNKSRKKYVGDYILEQGGINKIFESARANLICIISGTGSGKSYWVKNDLSKYGRILFVTSRAAKVLQDKDRTYSKSGFSADFKDKCNTVCTNWALSERIIQFCINTTKEDGMKALDKFIKEYDYIVFDEFHSLFCDSLFSDSIFTLAVFFCYCILKNKKKTIILTATREPINYFIKTLENIMKKDIESDGIIFFDFTKCCKYALPNKIRVIYKNKHKNDKIDFLLKKDEKIMYFMNFVGDKSSNNNDNNTGLNIFQEYAHIIDFGLSEEEIAVILSKDKQKEWDKAHNCQKSKKSSIQKNSNKEFIDLTYNEWVREEISLKGEIPDGVRVILCSATLNEGISIDNATEHPFGYVITDAHYISTLIQQMGRLRNNVKEFWVINDARQHPCSNEEIQHDFVLSKTEKDNSFLKCITNYADSIKDYQKREEFINWICKIKGFDLIAYSYITHRFEFNSIKYKMRNEINKVSNLNTENHSADTFIWQKELHDFAKKHNVSFSTVKDDKLVTEIVEYANIKKHIKPIVDLKFYGDEWKKEQEILKELNLGVTEKTINNNLKRLNCPFKFNKSSTKKHGKYTYWFTDLEE